MSMRYTELYQFNYNTALSHTIGNMTVLFMEHYKKQFPKNFFKSFYVDTAMNQKLFIEKRKSFLDLKKSKPILSISPKLDTARPEFATTSYFNIAYGKNMIDGRRNPAVASTLFYDKDKSLGVDFTINRIKLNFNVTQTYETIIQQINAFGIMNSSIRMEQLYSDTFVVEVPIPDNLIATMRVIAKLENVSNDVFLEEINKMSYYKIAYKLMTSTGKMKYFFYLRTAVKINIQTPDLGDGDNEGQVMDNFEITQSCSIEFNYVDTMITMSANKAPSELEGMSEDEIMNSAIIPVMTTQTGLVVPQLDDNGYSFYTTTEIIVDTMYSSDPDETNLMGMFVATDYRDMQYICKRDNITISEFMTNYYSFILTDEAEPMVIGKDYELDLEKMILSILEPKQFSTYVITIYRNSIALNNAISQDDIMKDK